MYRVLLVEDVPAVSRILRRHLEYRYQVKVAWNGHQALAALEEDPDWDAVLCDVGLPGPSGVEVYRRAVVRWPHLKHRFVFTTGGVDSLAELDVLEGLPSPVLEKPFTMPLLFQILEEHLGLYPGMARAV